MFLETTTAFTKMMANDYVGFTFFIGYMAMAAASVFSSLKEVVLIGNGKCHYLFRR